MAGDELSARTAAVMPIASASSRVFRHDPPGLPSGCGSRMLGTSSLWLVVVNLDELCVLNLGAGGIIRAGPGGWPG